MKRDCDIYLTLNNGVSNRQLKPQGIINSQFELDDIVEKGFEGLTYDKPQGKILVKLSGEM